ncbi:MAG: DUF5106 domain-containing protein, partial [Bacteroidota bacterium]|nr:DUF5106 domain-containing protein [Bacteroidota bacterium]
MKHFLTFLLYIIAFAGYSNNNDGFEIKIKLTGIPDTVCYLANYHGDKIFIKDTAKINHNGSFKFSGDTLLPRGLYLIAGQSNNKILEVIINNDQQFEIQSEYENIFDKIKVKGSKENKLFYEYIAFISSRQKQIAPLHKSLKKSENKDEIKQRITDINKEVTSYQEKFIKKNSDTFVAGFIKATKEITIPEPTDANDSTFKYRYYKAHYWDNIPLSDDRFLRTPFFHSHLQTYFEKVTAQHPDSLIAAIDNILAPLPDSSEINKYILWYVVQKYDNPKIMGFDKIFVHLSDEYFSKGKTGGIYPEVVKNIIERAKTISPLLLGKKAPNIIMLDSTQNPIALYSIESDYTVIIFWDSDCSHCKKEIPKLKKFYNNHKEKYNLEVYAVSADTSVNEWKNS